MRALVVFESMFGNTQAIARAVAEGISVAMNVDVAEVGGAPSTIAEDIGLLVVGGPTHAFGMTRPSTREDAAKQSRHGVVSAGPGLREWLADVRGGSPAVAAAAFDTRIDRPRVPGSAARGAQKRLRRLGFRIAAPAETFYVEGTSGPLLPGEEERARAWGTHLGSGLTSGQPEPVA